LNAVQIDEALARGARRNSTRRKAAWRRSAPNLAGDEPRAAGLDQFRSPLLGPPSRRLAVAEQLLAAVVQVLADTRPEKDARTRARALYSSPRTRGEGG
jgi:hypothetical protein